MLFTEKDNTQPAQARTGTFLPIPVLTKFKAKKADYRFDNFSGNWANIHHTDFGGDFPIKRVDDVGGPGFKYPARSDNGRAGYKIDWELTQGGAAESFRLILEVAHGNETKAVQISGTENKPLPQLYDVSQKGRRAVFREGNGFFEVKINIIKDSIQGGVMEQIQASSQNLNLPVLTNEVVVDPWITLPNNTTSVVLNQVTKRTRNHPFYWNDELYTYEQVKDTGFYDYTVSIPSGTYSSQNNERAEQTVTVEAKSLDGGSSLFTTSFTAWKQQTLKFYRNQNSGQTYTSWVEFEDPLATPPSGTGGPVEGVALSHSLETDWQTFNLQNKTMLISSSGEIPTTVGEANDERKIGLITPNGIINPPVGKEDATRVVWNPVTAETDWYLDVPGSVRKTIFTDLVNDTDITRLASIKQQYKSA